MKGAKRNVPGMLGLGMRIAFGETLLRRNFSLHIREIIGMKGAKRNVPGMLSLGMRIVLGGDVAGKGSPDCSEK